MVANEAVFLPIWLRYYSQFAGPADLYVIDHDTTDGSTDRPGFVRIPVHRRLTDWSWITEVVRVQQRKLLESYDIVLYGDVDEIVVPDPMFGDLAHYLAQFDDNFVNCRGWEIQHDPATEAPFDPARPVLAQRGWWFPNSAYDKPVLAREAMPWTGGFHGRTDGATNDDPRLFLLHLHRMDYDICLARHQQRVDRPWVQAQAVAGWGYQDRIVESAAFDDWFFHDATGSGRAVERQPIPPRWRNCL